VFHQTSRRVAGTYGWRAITAAALLSITAIAVPHAASTASRVVYVVPKAACNQSSKPGHAACLAITRSVLSHHIPGAVRLTLPVGLKNGTVGPEGGLTPTDLASAYAFNPASTVTNQTVAIVDAFNDPNLQTDLATFDTEYGLPVCASGCLKVVGETGSNSLAPNDTTGWTTEQALDVETVHSVCEHCKILLVEANSTSFADLAAAETTAANLHATEITNSFGGAESTISPPQEAAFNHPGIVITASTGDDGYYSFDRLDRVSQDEAPAALNTVVAVGGTSLFLNQSGGRSYETVWNDNGPHFIYAVSLGQSLGAGGGGCSTTQPAPAWQRGLKPWSATACGTKRLAADISAEADWITGLDIYSSYNCGSKCSPLGWETVGGTSLASPLIAAMFALAGGAHGVKYPALTLYGHLGTSAVNDITVGGNGYCDGEGAPQCGDENGPKYGVLDCDYPATSTTPSAGLLACDAATGYDGPSGVGTPNGLSVFAKTGPTATISGPTSASHGVSATWSAKSVKDPFQGSSVTKYVWNWGDGTTSTTAVPRASHSYGRAASNETITLTMTETYGMTGTAKLVISVA
jgi:hypothetical protein